MRLFSEQTASILISCVAALIFRSHGNAQQFIDPRSGQVFDSTPIDTGPIDWGLSSGGLGDDYGMVESYVDPTLALEIPIEKFRRSFYQGAEVLGGHLMDLGDANGGLDQTFEEARISFGLPIGSMDNILGLRPYFRADHFNGPDVIDVPGSVYETGVSILNQKKWSERFSSTIVITPSIRSDFQTSDNAFRLFGLALVNWQPRQELTISLGVVYFDRADFGVLPVVGLTYLPTPWWRIEATAPRPRISRRLWKDGGQAEGWAYLGGQIGGNTWAVKRTSGLSDELTVSEYQLIAGYEVIRAGNRGLFIEGGYVFGRSIEYEREDVDFDLDDAVAVRAGWRF